MERLKTRMERIKVDSYRDCVWYLEDIDKCKLGYEGENFECYCKDNDMDEFCIWITKFLQCTPDAPLTEKEIEHLLRPLEKEIEHLLRPLEKEDLIINLDSLLNRVVGGLKKMIH